VIFLKNGKGGENRGRMKGKQRENEGKTEEE
jgi:hypothetical protein